VADVPKRESHTFVLGDFGGVVAKERIRTSSKGGSSHVTLTVRAEPIAANLDPKTLGAAFALAMRTGLQQQIAAIAVPAAPATIKRREAARRALAEGKRWAVKQYSGGKLGIRPAGFASMDRLFNDSGRLVEGLKVSAIENGWIINVASNRLNPRDFTPAAYERMLNRLVELVPGLRDPRTLVDAIIEQMPDSTQVAVKAKGTGRNNPVLRATLLHKLNKAPGALSQELRDMVNDAEQAGDDLLDKLEQTLGRLADGVEAQQERGAEDEG
jgi:hypothetical protein